MSKFERLLEAGSTELPDCRCTAEMNLMAIVPVAGGDTEIRGVQYDSRRVSPGDLFVAMGAAAMMTKKIKLMTGVLIPSNRIPAVAASALGSLNKLAPGRIDFGVSTGFTARRTIGARPVKLAVFPVSTVPSLPRVMLETVTV